MRVLILSETISSKQRYNESKYTPPYDVHLDVADLNTENFKSTVFDYDVSIVHIEEPQYHSIGYFHNIPKLIQDSVISLQNGRAVICIPQSRSFRPESSGQYSDPIYEWLRHLGVELQENLGQDIRPTGAGKSDVFRAYLTNAPRYYQIVKKPKVEPPNRIAVVGETDIVVGCQLQAANGILVVLPPPLFDKNTYHVSMSNLIRVCRRYFERAQRRIPVSDTPDWLGEYQVARAKDLENQLAKLAEEKELYDRIAYVLYGTGEDLESSVACLLGQLGLDVEAQPPGSNVDLKALHRDSRLGFAIEVTGTKGTIRKDSKKVAQAWQFLSDRSGTPEEDYRMVVVANTEYHLDPKRRDCDPFTPNVVELLRNNGVLLITTGQLYDLWKSVHEGRREAEDVIRKLHESSGVFDE